jgi:hypothetical protein
LLLDPPPFVVPAQQVLPDPVQPRAGRTAGLVAETLQIEGDLSKELSSQLGRFGFGNPPSEPKEERLLPAQVQLAERVRVLAGATDELRIGFFHVTRIYTGDPETFPRLDAYTKKKGVPMTRADILHDDLAIAYGRHLERGRTRRRAMRTAAIASIGALALAGAALGAATLLGWPAPEHVKQEIAAVDRGLPEDLRLNPDVEHASAVASNGSSTLYAAALRDGGRCTELVTAGDRGRGATCTTGSDQLSRPIDLTVPADGSAGSNAPVVLAGRVNDPAATELEIAYEDGESNEVPLGDDRYFVFDVPVEHRASAHATGFSLVARDAQSSEVARISVPADWDDEAVPDEAAPLYVSTRSDESDFTKVYGLEGHVSAAGADSLELDYGDGARVPIAIQPDGSFAYTVPQDRVGDFMEPRVLLVRDEAGNAIASQPVAAVAYWRGRERGRR